MVNKLFFHLQKNIIKKIEKNYVKRGPINHGLFDPWANGLCANFQKTFLKKMRKDHDKFLKNPMMAFWVHDLTNVQPTFKKIIYKIEFGPSKFDKSWFFEFMVEWNCCHAHIFFHSAFNVDFSFIYISLVLLSFNLV
jgi:hypothetical protein